MDWMQITVLTTTEASDLISQLLMDAGSTGTMIEDKNDIQANQRPEGQWDILDESLAAKMGEDVKVTGYYPADEKANDIVAFVQGEVNRLKNADTGLPMGRMELIVSGFAGEDWAETWKKAFKPFRLGEHFVIRPGWTAYDAQPEDKVITIDPGMAFGTGTHETTGMCVALIEKYVKAGMRVIDIGTGTGILAMAAYKLGAGEVLATDLDPMAVRVAKENCEKNGCGEIAVRCGDLLEVVDVSGEVVIANIIADAVLMLAEPARARITDGGVFICSGILREREQEVAEKLTRCGYTLLDVCEKGEWCAIAARK